MADMTNAQEEEVSRLAKPAAASEAEIFGINEGREEALNEVDSAKVEEEALPKLSAAEFRIYNSMAEHMDLFVFRPSLKLAYPITDSRTAQPFPPILEPALPSMRSQPSTLQPLPQTIHLYGLTILFSFKHASFNRRTTFFPFACDEDAGI